jgi:hypothetical protein
MGAGSVEPTASSRDYQGRSAPFGANAIATVWYDFNDALTLILTIAFFFALHVWDRHERAAEGCPEKA